MNDQLAALLQLKQAIENEIATTTERIARLDEDYSLANQLQAWWAQKEFKVTLEREAKRIGADIEKLERQIAEQMVLDGIDSLKIRGVNFAPKRELFVSPDLDAITFGSDDESARDVVAKALLSTEFEGLVQRTYHHGRLRSLVKELVANGRENMKATGAVETDVREHLPASLRDVLRISETWGLSARRT